MKTILLIVPALGIGGQERIAVNTASCLKDGYDVKIIVFEKKTMEYEYPCEVFNINQSPKRGFFAKIINQFMRILKVASFRNKTKADVVISFGNSANITNAFSGLISRGQTISAVHGYAEVKRSASMRAIIHLSNKVICIAQAMQEGLLSIFPKAKNTIVIENGYDVSDIVRKSLEPIETEYPNLAIVSMGRMEHVKGFDRLIKAFALAKKTRADLNLVLLGKGSLHDELVALSKQEGVSESVHFWGCHSNPYKYLKKSFLYVMSSRNEGFPNSLIEALACELPVVSIDCQSGPREILSERYTSTRTVGIIEEKYGILVEESDSEEKNITRMADAILMLVNDEEKMKQYTNCAWERANHFNGEVYKNKVVSLIEEIK